MIVGDKTVYVGILSNRAERSNPVDPAGGYCYWGSIKPCKSDVKVINIGDKLSNTWTTYTQEGDNLGKLRVISYRQQVLE